MASQAIIRHSLLEAAAGAAVRLEAFCRTAKGSPRWWDLSISRILRADGGLLDCLLVSRDVTQAHSSREAAEIAAAEMQHRLKNSYAMVAGLLSALARGVPAREEFVREIGERLSALGVAQTLFVSSEHAPCGIRDLIPALLQPFSHPDCPVSVVGLPDAHVDQGQADALALVFGELAVNSTKHGALTGRGRIAVKAEIADGDVLTIVWDEQSSQPVASHDRVGGQGLKLIRRILAVHRGEMNVDWHEQGLTATIRMSGLRQPELR